MVQVCVEDLKRSILMVASLWSPSIHLLCLSDGWVSAVPGEGPDRWPRESRGMQESRFGGEVKEIQRAAAAASRRVSGASPHFCSIVARIDVWSEITDETWPGLEYG